MLLFQKLKEFVSKLTESKKELRKMHNPSFEVYRDRGGKWRWRLKASNGRIICDSAQGYKRKEDVYAGINSVRKYANSPIILIEDENRPTPS